MQEREHLARDCQMSSGQAANRENVCVLLQRGFNQLFRRLFEPREDYLHPGLHARMREELDRVDMAIEAGFTERDADFTLHRGNVEPGDRDAAVENRRDIPAM